MKILLFFLASAVHIAGAQIYLGRETAIHFLSKAALEDIEAVNKTAQPVLDTASGNIQIKISNRAFKFASSLMEDHFNENYMESEKYPYSIFRGKINEKIIYSKAGQNVSCTGTLDMHGVKKEVTINGTLSMKEGRIIITGNFKVKPADYNIKVPSLYVKNIAEDIAVDITSELQPFKKK